jgi:hypothetical protein
VKQERDESGTEIHLPAFMEVAGVSHLKIEMWAPEEKADSLRE